ncbi:N-acetylserotonin O-methyltransferase-like protein isoform X1 [Heterocephalus glaber]|uniref:N-acetylserotonin O-methyltransferase-like protein isoform X1 n=2 Tax=Heterocephalus glaber TaxID=10181 RepID=A0AAX6Q4I4_HETGA|nr:N-acetylserotonin O-methyltransferase-like protein isoform X1 [Heterocephalus glaber]
MALSPVLGKLLHKRVVLASASPRRQEILSNAGLRFEVVPSRFKETLSKSSFPSPYAYAMETAKQKALEVATRLHQKDLQAPDLVIGADTIVAVEGLILEKPVDKQDAYRMLSRLSGKQHSVFTGVCVVLCDSRDGQLETEVSEFYEETRVKFSELSEEMLWEYIHSGEPMDKAGGYGIQALGGMLVEAVHGDFLNVVGFPLNRFCKQLAQLYRPPSHQDLGSQAKQDSIHCVDSFEGLSDPEPKHGDGDVDLEPRSGPRDARPAFPASLLRLVHGFKAAQALFTACKLKVFDLLQDGAARTASDVAGKVKASVCGTRRLLDVCVGLGLLQKTERGYRNTEVAGMYLGSHGEYSLHSYILHTGGHAWDLFMHPASTAKEGRSHQHPAEGTKPGDPSQVQLERAQQHLLRAAHGLAQLTAHEVATAMDLSSFSSACHLGGCTGALAHELAREYPRLKVTVFDLPHIIQQAPLFRPHGPETAQVSFMPGDVLWDPFPEAELYILAPALPDWTGSAAQQLLRRVAAACRPGCGLLVADAFPMGEEEEEEEEELDEAEEEAEAGSAPAGLVRVLDQLVWPKAGGCSVGACCRWLEQLGFCDLQVAPSGDTQTATLTVLLGTRAGP